MVYRHIQRGFQHALPLLMLAALAFLAASRPPVLAQSSPAHVSATQAFPAQASSAPVGAGKTPESATTTLSATTPAVAAPAVPTPTDAREARQAYQEGPRDERTGNWDDALRNFDEAARASPGDRAIKLQLEVARAEKVRELTGQAEKEILSGQSDQARATLTAALELDPTYSTARERLAQITPPVASPAVQGAAPSVNSEGPGSAGLQLASGPAKIQASPGLHSFDYRGNTRGAYEEVARQFGVTAAFDADLNDRAIRFNVPSMDFETAMRVLGEQTNTFWRSVDSTTFFVAADTPDKRRTFEPEVQQVILLPESETNDEMTETSRVVRDIVGLRRSDLDLQARTLTVRDTLENVALAKALVAEIEKPRGEAMLDIDILEVDRQLARTMGITPPAEAQAFTLSSAQVQQLEQAPNVGTLDQILQTIFNGQSLAGASSALVPPLIAFGGGSTVFLATLPGASASLSQTLSVVRSAQRVLLRVEDGRPATFFVGEHFPITLALLSNSLAGGSSQFTSGALAGAFPAHRLYRRQQPSWPCHWHVRCQQQRQPGPRRGQPGGQHRFNFARQWRRHLRFPDNIRHGEWPGGGRGRQLQYEQHHQ